MGDSRPSGCRPVRSPGAPSARPPTTYARCRLVSECSRMFPSVESGKPCPLRQSRLRRLLPLTPLNPTQAEGVPRWICVDLEVVGVHVRCRLEHFGTQRHDTIVCGRCVIDPQLGTDLLLDAGAAPV